MSPKWPFRTIILIALLAGVLGAGGSIWLDRQSNIKQVASSYSVKSDDKPLLPSRAETDIKNDAIHGDVPNQFLAVNQAEYTPLDILKAVITRAD